MNHSRLLKLIEETAKAPCEGCKYQTPCAVDGLSCLAFNRYVETGRRFERMEADVPTRRIYERQLSEKPDHESYIEFTTMRKYGFL